MFPEHTLLSYRKSVEQGADYAECDVVVTRDLVLICSHEPWISLVSNVANNSMGGPEHKDFAGRSVLVDCKREPFGPTLGPTLRPSRDPLTLRMAISHVGGEEETVSI